ncbi:MAG: hypothetical protein RJP95_03655 [Pirellulales bacterium]
MTATLQALQERATVGTRARVDRSAGIIRGVKILGRESTNGRTYTPEAIRNALPMYEGARVNLDHTRNPNEPRSYRDRIGTLQNVFEDSAGGISGDLHYNTEHPQANQLARDAEHSPNSLGLSHNVRGNVTRRNGRQMVEAIDRVLSVDIVADPATTKSLFESRQHINETITRTDLSRQEWTQLLKEGRVDGLLEHDDGTFERFDLTEFVKRLKRR